MLQKSFFILLSIFLLSSCEASFQYDVYLNVAFKSQATKRGPTEETITIPPGETQRIISAIDISPKVNKMGTSAKHCKHVADYVTAYLQNDTPSKIKWCDKEISFARTDIQQAEFTITYTNDDF